MPKPPPKSSKRQRSGRPRFRLRGPLHLRPCLMKVRRWLLSGCRRLHYLGQCVCHARDARLPSPLYGMRCGPGAVRGARRRTCADTAPSGSRTRSMRQRRRVHCRRRALISSCAPAPLKDVGLVVCSPRPGIVSLASRITLNRMRAAAGIRGDAPRA